METCIIHEAFLTWGLLAPRLLAWDRGGLSDGRELSLWEAGLDTPKSHLTSANLSRKTGEYMEMAKVELETPGSQRY